MFLSLTFGKGILNTSEAFMFKFFEVQSLFEGNTFKHKVVLIHGLHLIRDSAKVYSNPDSALIIICFHWFLLLKVTL